MIVVTPDGRGTYASLAEAVAAAPVGATIRLTAGVHRVERGVLLSQAVTLIGEGRTSTEIVATQGDYALRYEGSGLFQLQDLTVRWAGAATETTAVVSVQKGEVQIERCRFTGAPASGLAVRGTVSGLIAACTSDGNGVGILVGDQAQPLLEGNTCEQNKRAGIGYGESAAGTARQNVCHSNKQYGIVVIGQAQPLLASNICESNSQWDIYADTQARPTLRDNVAGVDRVYPKPKKRFWS